MSEAIPLKEWQSLPKEAQQEVRDFFQFIKLKYARKPKAPETALLSEDALAEDWLKEEEETAWAKFQ